MLRVEWERELGGMWCVLGMCSWAKETNERATHTKETCYACENIMNRYNIFIYCRISNKKMIFPTFPLNRTHRTHRIHAVAHVAGYIRLIAPQTHHAHAPFTQKYITRLAYPRPYSQPAISQQYLDKSIERYYMCDIIMLFRQNDVRPFRRTDWNAKKCVCGGECNRIDWIPYVSLAWWKPQKCRATRTTLSHRWRRRCRRIVRYVYISPDLVCI